MRIPVVSHEVHGGDKGRKEEVRLRAPTALRVTRWVCLTAVAIEAAHEYGRLCVATAREDMRYRILFLQEWGRQHPSKAEGRKQNEEFPKVEVPNQKYSKEDESGKQEIRKMKNRL